MSSLYFQRLVFLDWTIPVSGYSSSVYSNDHELYGPTNLWDNKLGRTKQDFNQGGCFHSTTPGPHSINFDLGSEFNVTAITMLNRRDYRR